MDALRTTFAQAISGNQSALSTGRNKSFTVAPLIPSVALLDNPTKNLHTIWLANVLLNAVPAMKHRYANVKDKYTGLRPTLCESGPVNKHPVPMPKRNMAVSRLSATGLTWYIALDFTETSESDAPAQACTKTSKTRMMIARARWAKGQFRGSMGSEEEVHSTRKCSSLLVPPALLVSYDSIPVP
jgi:hypothetical protein